MKTEHWTGEMPCSINGFRNFEFLIKNGSQFLRNRIFTKATYKIRTYNPLTTKNIL